MTYICIKRKNEPSEKHEFLKIQNCSGLNEASKKASEIFNCEENNITCRDLATFTDLEDLLRFLNL